MFVYLCVAQDNSSSSVAQRCQKAGHPYRLCLPSLLPKSVINLCMIILQPRGLWKMLHKALLLLLPVLDLFLALPPEMNITLKLMKIILKWISTFLLFNTERVALAGVAHWMSAGLRTKGSLVQFPVRAHAWVAGQAPSEGCERRAHVDASLSLFLPPFPSKNK